MLDVKALDLSIACEAATKLALHVTDMRSDSALTLEGKNWNAKAAQLGARQRGALGLGKSGDKDIGAWAMWMEPDAIKADGKAVDFIGISSMPSAANSEWTKPDTGIAWLARSGDNYKSWAATGTFTPIAIKNLTGTLSVQAGINKGSELDLTKAIQLDGMATIQMFYL